MTSVNKRAYKAWRKEVGRLYAIMTGKELVVWGARDDAMVEFWFEHGCTEGKAVELILEYGI